MQACLSGEGKWDASAGVLEAHHSHLRGNGGEGVERPRGGGWWGERARGRNEEAEVGMFCR